MPSSYALIPSLYRFSKITDPFWCKIGREAILDGMLGCNLVTFQTHSYARHFLSSCVRVMGYEARLGGVDAHGNITRIAHCPIGIDVDKVEKDRKNPGVALKIEALRRLYAGKKIIVGRDKLDPTKGVLPKVRSSLLFFLSLLGLTSNWACSSFELTNDSFTIIPNGLTKSS